MFPYYLFYAVEFALLLGGVAANTRQQRTVVLALSVVLLALFSGLRGLVGTDTAAYHEVFKSIDPSSLTAEDWFLFEPFFLAVFLFVKFIVDDPFFFLLVVSAIQGVLVFLICKNRQSGWVFLFAYLCGFYLQNQFNVVRAGIAVLVLIYAHVWRMSGRNNLPLLATAVLFHYSAALAIPFLVDGRYKWRLLAWGGGALVFAVAFGASERIVEKLAFYFIDSGFYSQGKIEIGPFFVLTTLVALVTHLVANRGKGGQIHALFAFVLALKILQMLFPIVWRLHDVMYFLWLAMTALMLGGRAQTKIGLGIIVLSVINLWFVTFYALEHEGDILADRANKTGEVGEIAFDSPLVPYRTFFDR